MRKFARFALLKNPLALGALSRFVPRTRWLGDATAVNGVKTTCLLLTATTIGSSKLLLHGVVEDATIIHAVTQARTGSVSATIANRMDLDSAVDSAHVPAVTKGILSLSAWARFVAQRLFTQEAAAVIPYSKSFSSAMQ